MNNKVFKIIATEQFKKCLEILNKKSKEYSDNKDRLHNFKCAALSLNVSPEKALWGMAVKHYISIQDIVYNIEIDIPTLELLEEKIGDMINYLIMLKAMIIERKEKLNNKKE